MNKDEIKNYIKKHLSKFRYLHSLKVADEAKKLAKIYKIDLEKAYLVGLTHDIAKEFSVEENMFWIEKNKLSHKYLEKSYKNILHSDIGAIVAKDLFSFDDDMCKAIKYHTIGNVCMNRFDKVIFIADKIARDNLDDSLKQVKDLVYSGYLDKALLRYFESLTINLKSRGLKLHPSCLKLIELLKNN